MNVTSNAFILFHVLVTLNFCPCKLTVDVWTECFMNIEKAVWWNNYQNCFIKRSISTLMKSEKRSWRKWNMNLNFFQFSLFTTFKSYALSIYLCSKYNSMVLSVRLHHAFRVPKWMFSFNHYCAASTHFNRFIHF